MSLRRHPDEAVSHGAYVALRKNYHAAVAECDRYRAALEWIASRGGYFAMAVARETLECGSKAGQSRSDNAS